MPIQVELYTAEGVAIAVVARVGTLRDIVEAGRDLVLDGATWHPLDGGPARPAGELRLAPDDIHIAVSDTSDDAPVHAQWHDVSVDLGPYRATGQMPTMPGFDPGRALARPTGEFVLLRDVEITLLGQEAAGSVRQRTALVNRYVVDRVEADLMLGFFFPGAEMVVTRGHDTVEAGASGTTIAAPSVTAATPGDTATVTAPGVA
ncbi:MAG TPA: hypothetical protein VNM34_12265 [Verrucomicrobiae bacterium]|nr:hypothetical protein [Verrucomicrobiae bacterium]